MIPERSFRDGSLLLLPVDPDRDTPGLYQIFQDERMHTYTGNRVPEHPEEIHQLLRGYCQHPDIWAWSIYDGAIFVGTYWMAVPVEMDGKRIIPADAQRIGVPFWRQGYARRCRDLLYRFAFEELGAAEIHGQAWGENVNSCMAMKHYGFSLERASENFNQKHQRMMTGHEYVLTADRFWETHKKAPGEPGAEVIFSEA